MFIKLTATDALDRFAWMPRLDPETGKHRSKLYPGETFHFELFSTANGSLPPEWGELAPGSPAPLASEVGESWRKEPTCESRWIDGWLKLRNHGIGNPAAIAMRIPTEGGGWTHLTFAQMGCQPPALTPELLQTVVRPEESIPDRAHGMEAQLLSNALAQVSRDFDAQISEETLDESAYEEFWGCVWVVEQTAARLRRMRVRGGLRINQPLEGWTALARTAQAMAVHLADKLRIPASAIPAAQSAYSSYADLDCYRRYLDEALRRQRPVARDPQLQGPADRHPCTAGGMPGPNRQ